MPPPGRLRGSKATEAAAAAVAAAAQAAKPKRRDVRIAGGKVWVDPSLEDWPENDYRLFVGDLAPEVTEGDLRTLFGEYPSFQMARIIYDKISSKSKGYGFASLLDVMDAAKAIRDKNRKYLRSRPITVRWSQWQKRSIAALSNEERKEQMKLVKAATSINPVEARRQKRREAKALKAKREAAAP